MDKPDTKMVRIQTSLANTLDRYVDGLVFKSRAHAVNVIVQNWIEKKRIENNEIIGIKEDRK